MKLTRSPKLRGLCVTTATLTLALLAQAGCNSEAEPFAETGGNTNQAGSTNPPASSGSGGEVQSAGGAASTVGGGTSAGSAGQPVTTAGMGGGTSMAGSAATAGAATAGNSSGGVSGGAGTGGSAGDGTKPIKVWLAGDSTMQNCSGTCPCGWGSQFDALFNDKVTVVNSAVGGRSIQSWLYEASVGSLQNGECALTSQTYDKRWSAMLDASTGMKPGDYLFIQFGINDTDSGCPKHVGTELFKKYLDTMAKAAKERGAQPVFVTPVSAIICQGAVAQPTRGRFVTATVEAATASGVPLLDLHQLSIDLYNKLGFCPNDENYGAGKVGDFFCQDHTHFEAAGAKQIATLVAGALPTAAPPLAQYVK